MTLVILGGLSPTKMFGRLKCHCSFLYVLIYIFIGIGMGITFMTAIVAVGRYFNKRRALATGIAMSGAGFGMFVYPFFTDLILQIFGWRGTVLLIAGTFLNCAVSGALFRPISKNEPECNTRYDSKEKELLVEPSEKTPPFCVSKKWPITIGHGTAYSSLPDMNTKPLRDEQFKKTSTSLTSITKVNSNFHYRLLKKNIFHSGFLQISCDKMALDNNIINENKNTDTDNSCRAKIRENFLILKDPLFILVLVSMVSWSVQYICTIYISDFAFSKGVSREESALAVSIIGLSNTIGRIVTGFIVDFLNIKSKTLYLIAFIVAATTTFLLPLCSTFWLIALYCTTSGFCVGTCVAMRTILIVDVVGIDNLAYAFGWASFFQGVFCIPVPPLAGFIYDVTRNYSSTFIMVACFYSCGIVSCLILHFIGNRGSKQVLLVRDENE